MGSRGGFTWLGAMAGHRAAGVGSSISRSWAQQLQQLQHVSGFWKERDGHSPIRSPKMHLSSADSTHSRRSLSQGGPLKP